MNKALLGGIICVILCTRLQLFADSTNVARRIELGNKDLRELPQEFPKDWLLDAWEWERHAFQLQEEGVPLLEDLLFKTPIPEDQREAYAGWRQRLAIKISRDGCPATKNLLIRYYYSEPAISNALPYLGDVEKIRWVVNKSLWYDSTKIRNMWPIKSILFETNGLCTVMTVPDEIIYLKKAILHGTEFWFPTGWKMPDADISYMMKYYVVTNAEIKYESGLLPGFPKEPPRIEK